MKTIIIGAGQAGLAMSYQLTKQGIDHIIFERSNGIATTWRERYDALKLITPNWMNSLDGMEFPGKADEFSARDDVIKYLEAYAEMIQAPIKFGQNVVSLIKTENEYLLETNKEQIKCNNVIIATGPFQLPKIPKFSKKISSDIIQIHSHDYKNSSQILGDSVLVVGSGNSGVQIAIDLSKEKKVYHSKETNFRIPRSLTGSKFIDVIKKFEIYDKNISDNEMEKEKDFMYWMDKLGLYEMPLDSSFGRILSKGSDPFVGDDIDTLLNNYNVVNLQKCTGFSGDEFKFENNTSLKVKSVIWATGYEADYSWIKIPMLNNSGKPVHSLASDGLTISIFVNTGKAIAPPPSLVAPATIDPNIIVSEICQLSKI